MLSDNIVPLSRRSRRQGNLTVGDGGTGFARVPVPWRLEGSTDLMNLYALRTRLTAVLGLGVVVFMCVSTSTAADGDDGHHYYYFKEKKSVGLDVARVAVFQDNKTPTAARDAALNRFGITPDQLTPTAIPGWAYAAPPAAERTPERVRELITRMARDRDLCFVSPVFTDDYGPVIVTQDILVRFQEGITPEQAEEVLAGVADCDIAERDFGNMPRAFRLRSRSRNGLDVLTTANALAQRPEVTYAEPDFILTARRSQFFPDDPGFQNGLTWGLHNTGQSGGTPDMDMDGPEAWSITTGDPNIIVVIFDDGVQQNHPDINQIPGRNFTTGPNTGGGPQNECDNHGTAVAGCVSAIINNGLGTVGIAPGSRIASARFTISSVPCDGSGSFSVSWLVNALDWAQTIGARVTNNSNSFSSNSSITSKYDETRAAGLIHFAAAGNNSSGTLIYPASLASVHAVMSITRTGARSSFSNWGPGVAYAAPGSAIYTTDRTGLAGYSTGDYATVSGTSFASPYAAGVAAMTLSGNPSLTPAEVDAIMQQTAKDLGASGYDTMFGWGLVNAHHALLEALDCGPTITSEPVGVTVQTGQTIMLSVAADGDPPISYRWRRNTTALNDDSRISGATTATLTISPAFLADAGGYDVVVTDWCLSATSTTATVTVLAGIPGDFDADGDVDMTDYAFLQRCLTGPAVPPADPLCLLADLDGDNDVDANDVVIFMSCLSGENLAADPHCGP